MAVYESSFFLVIESVYLQEVVRWLLLFSFIWLDFSHTSSGKVFTSIVSVGLSSGDKTEIILNVINQSS